MVYSIESGPDGATIDSSTGEFSWTPTATQTPGVFEVVVAVSDGAGGSDTETFEIRVTVDNESPVLAAIQDQTVNELEEFSVQAVATDGDIPAQTITYSLSEAPTGATIDGSTGEITWTPTESDGPGTYDFTVVATDTEGASDSESFQLVVNEVNLAPVIGAIEDQAIADGESVELTITATDADTPANTLVYSIESGPDGATIDSSTGCLLYTSPSPRDRQKSRMPSSA